MPDLKKKKKSLDKLTAATTTATGDTDSDLSACLGAALLYTAQFDTTGCIAAIGLGIAQRLDALLAFYP